MNQLNAIVSYVPSSIHSIVSYVPFSSNTLKSASLICLGAGASALVSDYYSMFGWGAVASTLVMTAIQQVKAGIEKKLQREAASLLFCDKILNWIKDSMNYEKNPYTKETRESMLQLVEELKKENVCIRQGNDDLRAPYVGIQNTFEYVLTAQKILSVVSIVVIGIHTPLPATPLCSRLSEPHKVTDLIAASLRHDVDKILTVADRRISLRRLLDQAGTLLYALYPTGGLAQRKVEEQKVFLEEVAHYEGKLIDVELDCKQLDPSKVGAIYFFTDESGNQYAFSIMSQQAINPKELSTWGIWFGMLPNQKVHDRALEITDFIKDKNGPNLLDVFSKKCLTSCQTERRSVSSSAPEYV
jgi:hypothetical protein